MTESPGYQPDQFESPRSKNLRMFLFNNPTIITAPQRVYTVDPYRFHTEPNSTLTTTIISAAPKDNLKSLKEFEEMVDRFWKEVDGYFREEVVGGMVFHYDSTRANGTYNAPSFLLVEPAEDAEIEAFEQHNPPSWEKVVLYDGKKNVTKVIFVHVLPHKDLLTKYKSNDSPYRQNAIPEDDFVKVAMRMDSDSSSVQSPFAIPVMEEVRPPRRTIATRG